MAIKEIKNTFILDFEQQGFITVLDKNTITGIHKYKNIIINNVDLDDNIRMTTNKGFILEILKKSNDSEFMYRLILEDQYKNGINFNGVIPTGYHSKYEELEQFLENIIHH